MKNVDVLYERIIYFQQKEGFLNDFVRTSESLVFFICFFSRKYFIYWINNGINDDEEDDDDCGDHDYDDYE